MHTNATRIVALWAVLSSACGQTHSPSPDDGGTELDSEVVLEDGGLLLDAGPPDVGIDAASEPCAVPGTTEQVPCGMCGAIDRFCTADRVWTYGVCRGEHGECLAGTTATMACGNCGTGPVRCNASCDWETAGVCAGEGVCAPGTHSRSSEGCAAGETRERVCDETCGYVPSGSCMADPCPSAGATETVACGWCGRSSRFCGASLTWEYGPCADERECMPGTTMMIACGMCGTRPARCDATCSFVPSGACTGEGTCTPGRTTLTSAGCPAGETRAVRCDDACALTIEVSPCAASQPVDVTFVIDRTGSNIGAVSGIATVLQTACFAPLLELTDVRVGVSYSGDYPIDPYGNPGDRPFQGGIEPGTSLDDLIGATSVMPEFQGGDGDEAIVEMLSILLGGPISSYSTALTCSADRVAGGCWRPTAIPVIVLVSGGSAHNGPTVGTSVLHSPYVGITPAPAAWPAVEARFADTGALLMIFNSEGTDPTQHNDMLTRLGQPTSDAQPAMSTGATSIACDALVARVRGIAGL